MRTLPPFVGTLLLTLFACATAYSRIGETPAEIEQRYGPGQKSGQRFPSSTEMKYSKDGYIIFVHFIEGKSMMEQFKRATGGKWSNSEVSTFLQTFTSGEPWSYSKHDKIWYYQNKNVVARRENGHDDWLWIENREVTRRYESDKTLGF